MADAACDADLPAAKRSGTCAGERVKIWYAEFGKAIGVLLHGGSHATIGASGAVAGQEHQVMSWTAWPWAARGDWQAFRL